MLESLSVSELVAALILLSAAVAAIATLTKPIRKALGRIKKLEDAVFDKGGNPTFPMKADVFDKDGNVAFSTKTEVDDIKQNTEEIKGATNIICDAVMALLDTQINGEDKDQLRSIKGRLEKQRDIV